MVQFILPPRREQAPVETGAVAPDSGTTTFTLPPRREEVTRVKKAEAVSGFLTPEVKAQIIGSQPEFDFTALERGTFQPEQFKQAIAAAQPEAPTVLGGVGAVAGKLIGAPARATLRGVGAVAKAGSEIIESLTPEFVKDAFAKVSEAGQVIGGALDLKPLLPDPVVRGIESGQITMDELTGKLGDIIDQNPEIKKDLEASGNILMFAGEVLALKGAGQVIKGGIREISAQLKKDAPEISTIIDKAEAGKKLTANERTALVNAAESKGVRSELADSFSTSLNKIDPTKQIRFNEITGKTAGQWLNERGFTGTRSKNVEDLSKFWQKSKGLVDDALSKSTVRVNNPVLNEALEELTEKAVKTRSKKLQKSINSISEELENTGGLTLSRTNELKRLYERNINIETKRDITKGSDAKLRAQNIDDELREFLIDEADKAGIKNIRELNKETQAARFLADNIAGKQLKQAANNTMSLTDNILFTGGAIGSIVNPAFLGLFGLKKILTTEIIRSGVIKSLSKGKVKPLEAPDVRLIKREEQLQSVKKKVKLTDKDSDPLAKQAQKFKTTEDVKSLPAVRMISGGSEDIASLEKTINIKAKEATGQTEFNDIVLKEKKKWAEGVLNNAKDEPVKVNLMSDGDFLFSDGHHRVLAGSILKREIPIKIIKSDLPNELLGQYIALIKKGLTRNRLIDVTGGGKITKKQLTDLLNKAKNKEPPSN